MTAEILTFPSRGLLARDLCNGSRQHAAPARQIVEVVGLNRPLGEEINFLLGRAVRIPKALLVSPDCADGAAQLIGKAQLGPSLLVSPLRKLHSTPKPNASLPKWLYYSLALWQYANMANGQIVYIRRVANDDDAPNRILELLTARGMSQADLARLSNVSVSALNKVIKGTRGLDQEWMRRLAPHLGVSPAELLPREDNPLILDDAERELIQRFRQADRSTRSQLERVTQALMPSDREADAA